MTAGWEQGTQGRAGQESVGKLRAGTPVLRCQNWTLPWPAADAMGPTGPG